MSSNPFVRSLGLTGFDEFSRQQGLKPSEMLRRASLPAEVLQRQDGILSYRRYCALLDLCGQASGNPLFGLQYGLHQGVSVFGDLIYLIRNSATVGDALSELRSNFSLYNGAAEIGFDVAGDTALLSFQIGEGDLPGRAQAEELACGVALQLLRMLVGSDWHPASLSLAHPALGPESAYVAALGVRPDFSTARTELGFASSMLSLPLSTADAALHGMITAHLGRMERLAADELPSYVRQLLRDLLPSGRATVEKVSDCMALSPRTLLRRLSLGGTSFQKLLDETRQELARNYLNTPNVSIAQLAELLGYSDTSGFIRAFNRWFNATPLEWQRKHGAKRQPRMLRSRR
jgi:AraC-like DNA-binding protein